MHHALVRLMYSKRNRTQFKKLTGFNGIDDGLTPLGGLTSGYFL
jgi:hypothetical protein